LGKLNQGHTQCALLRLFKTVCAAYEDEPACAFLNAGNSNLLTILEYVRYRNGYSVLLLATYLAGR